LNADADDYVYSISMTTRPPRQGEINGRDYWFVDQDEFLQKIKNNEFIEYEQVHGWYYGTPTRPIQQWLKEGKVVLLDLDVLGALALKKQFSRNIVLIFLRPPNAAALIERLKKRSTETSRQIDRRLERAPAEMEKADEFDRIIVNKDLDETIKQVKKIIKNKRNSIKNYMEV
jgi:guanylate kinase